MSSLRRIVMVRHGETVGESSSRFHGSSDVELSDAGRSLMRDAAARLRSEPFDHVVASPLRRSWEGAWIVSEGAPVRLDADLREIDFGRWEGLSKEEIEAADPVAYQDWQAGSDGFEFPNGERRGDFRARVLRGFENLERSGARTALLVVHKGVIRTIAQHLAGEAMPAGEPDLGAIVSFSRNASDAWIRGKRSSNPPALDEAAA